MCGIGGFSLSDKSKINSRKAANVMLGLLEQRGSEASGAAWHSQTGSGYIKRDVRGSALNLKAMPRRTEAVILHTRLATHGSTRDQRNNHPVQSPDGTIKLVHNGVIYNHDLLRTELRYKLPAVDTSVIPAVLQDHSLDGIAKLEGDASIAWLSDDQFGRLNIARIEHSPLVICQVQDGSFFFASTQAIMDKFLKKMKLFATFQLQMPERLGYAIERGRIVETLPIPEIDPDYITPIIRGRSNWRSMTAGNRSPHPWDTEENPYEGFSFEPKSEIESDFEDWLSNNFLYTNGEYFTYDGYFVGDRPEMLKKFEEESYWNYWETQVGQQ